MIIPMLVLVNVEAEGDTPEETLTIATLTATTVLKAALDYYPYNRIGNPAMGEITHQVSFDRVVEADIDIPCPDCGGSGELILNPNWPSGTEPYSEKCSTCGGMKDARI